MIRGVPTQSGLTVWAIKPQSDGVVTIQPDVIHFIGMEVDCESISEHDVIANWASFAADPGRNYWRTGLNPR